MLHRNDDRKAKIDWINSKLDQQEQRVSQTSGGFTTDEIAKLSAIEAAWRNDIEPLKKLYPELAPFLRPRKRMKKLTLDPLTVVANDVVRIRTHWKNHPEQKIQGATAAIEIAIARHDDRSAQYRKLVTVEAVLARLKPSGTHRK